MKGKIYTFCMALSLLFITSTASATLITGDIDFTGMSETTTDATGITAIDFLNDSAWVLDGTDDFAQFIMQTASFTDLDTISATPSLWSIGIFTFDLLNISANGINSNGSAYVSGTGIVSADGYEDTIYAWSYTTQGVGSENTNKSSFSASAVPAPAGIALLGFALLGFAAMRRNRQS